MRHSILGVLLSVLMISCGGDDPPEPLPVPPPVPPPAPMPHPRPILKSFEGTWLTDQGALVIHDAGDRHLPYSGVFLPFRHPPSCFWSGRGEELVFRGMDGPLRWGSTLRLIDQGHGIEGRVWLAGSSEKLPCRGKRVGDSSRAGVPALVETLSDEDPWLRRSAVEALGALGPAAVSAIPAILRRLGDPDPEVARRSAAVLARLGPPPSEYARALCCNLRDASPKVRSATADCLGNLGQPGASEAAGLLSLLDEDQDPGVRTSALNAIARIGKTSSSALKSALHGTDPGTAQGIFKALADQGGRAALSSLATELRDETLRAMAASALVAVASEAPAIGSESPGEDWPQWRGPRKDNVSRETGLLTHWPEQGPPRAWEVWGLGSGIAAPAVRDGRVFVLGYACGWEYLAALRLDDGQCLWTARLGPGEVEHSHMRWVAQRTPSVDEERVYAYMNSGVLVCLRARDGVELWRLDYSSRFGVRRREYGFTDHPFRDGARLICTPASEQATLAALDPETGKVLWTSLAPGWPTSCAPSTILMDVNGVRQFIVSTGDVAGFRADDGKHLWSSPEWSGYKVQVLTPMIAPGPVLLARTSDWRKIALYRLPWAGKVQPAAVRRLNFGWLQDSTLVLGDFLYIPNGSSLDRIPADLATDARISVAHGTGNDASMVSAEDRLYVLGSEGKLALVDLTEDGMIVQSTFEIPMFERSSGTTNPVVARGRLLIRDGDRILCYDVRANAPHTAASAQQPSRALDPQASPPTQGGPPRAAFVPTPRDVVARMLELSGIRASDLVVDLGSGDGRILHAAAKSYGARAVGYEIDGDLVKTSLRIAREEGLSDRIRVEARDLFTADLSGADVVALYLPEELLPRLRPQLEKLRPGARVVSHQFRIPGVKPDQEAWVESTEDGARHAIYLWKAPLWKEGDR